MTSDNSWALVTGASSGIGRALAKELAESGHDLFLTARRRDRLEALAAEIEAAHGRKAEILAGDLNDPATPQALYDAIKVHGGRLDVLVNNAGHGQYGPTLEIDLATQLSVNQVNLNAMVALTGLFGPDMVARGDGLIINLASIAAFQPAPFLNVYGAGKAYILNYSLALANELSGTGVKVNCLCPGITKTEILSLGGLDHLYFFSNLLASPDKVAAKGLRAARNGRRFYVPYLHNWLLVQSSRLVPRRLSTAIARVVMKL